MSSLVGTKWCFNKTPALTDIQDNSFDINFTPQTEVYNNSSDEWTNEAYHPITITGGTLKIVVLIQEPATYYNSYDYKIVEELDGGNS